MLCTAQLNVSMLQYTGVHPGDSDIECSVHELELQYMACLQ